MEGNNQQLGTAPLGKLMFQLAIPTVFAQIVNLLYNMVDRIYVGRIPETGSLSLAGLGVAFPAILLISAFSALVGMGGAPRASICMGQKDHEGAERILGSSTAFLVVLSVILSVFFFWVKEPLLMLFGASENTIGYANQYLSIYLFGTIAVQISLGLNQFITCQGFAKTGMMTVLIGAVINIVLDPIFIYGFHMGVQGAALATVISQTVSAVWVVIFLCGKKSTIKIKKKYFKLDRKVLLPVLLLGISPFIMQSTECLVQLTFNTGMQSYGNDYYVGAMTILFSLS
ncbi:MAG: MATE family efflux transporter, partial [Hungatella sp.]